jgi:hypothetical protein
MFLSDRVPVFACHILSARASTLDGFGTASLMLHEEPFDVS